MNGKVQKFIIIPICSVYDNGELVREERMKPRTHYTVRDINLKEVAKFLEDEANERFFSKIQAPNSSGPPSDRESGGEG